MFMRVPKESSEYIKQKHKSTITLTDLKITLTRRSMINKDTGHLRNIIKLNDLYGTLYPQTAEYSLYADILSVSVTSTIS